MPSRPSRRAWPSINSRGRSRRAIGALDRELFDLAARLEASVDFPDEGYHFVAPGEACAALSRVRDGIDGLLATSRAGRVIREGRHIAILGKPNVGKSSLFNQLVGTDRAIVAAGPGTTRDMLRETIDLDGIRLGLVDTAGIRASGDEVEREGVVRARGAASVADLVVLVLDRSRPLEEIDRRAPARDRRRAARRRDQQDRSRSAVADRGARSVCPGFGVRDSGFGTTRSPRPESRKPEASRRTWFRRKPTAFGRSSHASRIPIPNPESRAPCDSAVPEVRRGSGGVARGDAGGARRGGAAARRADGDQRAPRNAAAPGARGAGARDREHRRQAPRRPGRGSRRARNSCSRISRTRAAPSRK